MKKKIILTVVLGLLCVFSIILGTLYLIDLMENIKVIDFMKDSYLVYKDNIKAFRFENIKLIFQTIVLLIVSILSVLKIVFIFKSKNQ